MEKGLLTSFDIFWRSVGNSMEKSSLPQRLQQSKTGTQITDLLDCRGRLDFYGWLQNQEIPYRCWRRKRYSFLVVEMVGGSWDQGGSVTRGHVKRFIPSWCYKHRFGASPCSGPVSGHLRRRLVVNVGSEGKEHFHRPLRIGPNLSRLRRIPMALPLFLHSFILSLAHSLPLSFRCRSPLGAGVPAEAESEMDSVCA
jgi:hypothetical protein